MGHALGPAERQDMGPLPGVWGQDPVIAVTMDARGQDGLREALEELEGCEQRLGAAGDESRKLGDMLDRATRPSLTYRC